MTVAELNSIITGKGFKTEVIGSFMGYQYVFVKGRRATESAVADALVGTEADGKVEIKKVAGVVAVYVPGSKS